MVQLVAKPLPLPLSPLPSFPSASLLFLSWEEVAASESQPHYSLPPVISRERGRVGGKYADVSRVPGPRAASQGTVGVGDYQHADNVSGMLR